MPKKPFKKIYIEITNICNLSCSFCPKSARKPQMMTPAEFEHILMEIKPWTDYIYLHVKGEPLLHPDLEQFLALAKSYGFFVNITTNGTLLHQKKDILLAHPPRQVNISLHSFEANTHLPGQMSFKDYVNQSIAFAKHFSPEHGITTFRLWNLDPENMTVDQRDKNRYILDTLYTAYNFDGQTNHRHYLATDAKLADKTYLSFDHEFQWPSLDALDFGDCGTCQGLRTHAAILCDGTVIPCCLDGEGVINLGNIHTTPFEEIMHSARTQTIRQGFQNKHITEELCRRCGYRTRF